MSRVSRQPVELFAEIEAAFSSGGTESALSTLANRLQAAKRFQELFQVRLMQIRERHKLPIADDVELEKLPEPLRGEMEREYLEACREVGWGLFQLGQIRDAWRYLRPAGEQSKVAAELKQIAAGEGEKHELIDIALHEGVAPELGFELLLREHGTCNAISAMETVMNQFSLPVRQTAAAMLVRQLHRELLASVSSNIAEREQKTPVDKSLAALIGPREWLFAEKRYHVDVSHLAAVVRSAQLIEDHATLRLALDLTEYGRRLDPEHQISDDEPFADTYPSHALFFAAQLGTQVDETVAFFAARAAAVRTQPSGLFPAEVYVTLLVRLKRLRDAIAAHEQYLAGRAASGFAPSLRELCKMAGDFEPLVNRSRAEGDLIGFVTGLAERSQLGR